MAPFREQYVKPSLTQLTYSADPTVTMSQGCKSEGAGPTSAGPSGCTSADGLTACTGTIS